MNPLKNKLIDTIAGFICISVQNYDDAQLNRERKNHLAASESKPRSRYNGDSL